LEEKVRELRRTANRKKWLPNRRTRSRFWGLQGGEELVGRCEARGAQEKVAHELRRPANKKTWLQNRRTREIEGQNELAKAAHIRTWLSFGSLQGREELVGRAEARGAQEEVAHHLHALPRHLRERLLYRHPTGPNPMIGWTGLAAWEFGVPVSR